MYHGLLSRKASHYKKVLVYPDNVHTSYCTEYYGDTEEEERQYDDIAEINNFSQHGSYPHQEDSELDMDDTLRNCHEKMSD